MSDKLTSLRLLVILFLAPGLGAEMDSRLELTQEECDWLLANPVVRVGVDEGYPPANFWDDNGRVRGIDADFLAAISELTGIAFEFVKMDSWTATIDAVRNGELDMVTCLTSTPEREEFLAFTDVYFDFPIAVITRSEAEFFSTPSAMRGKQVAVPEGFVTHKVMQSIGWEVEVMRVPTIADAYFAVSTGQCYATVGNLGNASYLIPRLGITNLKISGVMPEFTRSRFAVRKDWAILAGIIDKYFASLSEVERGAIVERWVRLEVPEKFDWTLIIQIAIALFIGVVAVVWFMLWRNRQLRGQLLEREKYNAAVEEAHAQASRLNEEKSDLLHMVAHDLRGPLMTFQTGVDIVGQKTKSSDDRDLGEVLLRMHRQTEAMQSLIAGLLDVEAIENGSRQLRLQPVNLRASIEQVIELQQESVARKQIELEWCAPIGTHKVIGDTVALRQVAENLVSNALKYSPLGGRVVLRLIEESERLAFEVQDFGPGLTIDDQAKLFTKFGRLTNRPTDGESSHGLGLYIVKALTEGMRGEVEFESQLGRGSTFRVWFQRAEPPE